MQDFEFVGLGGAHAEDRGDGDDGQARQALNFLDMCLSPYRYSWFAMVRRDQGRSRRGLHEDQNQISTCAPYDTALVLLAGKS